MKFLMIFALLFLPFSISAQTKPKKKSKKLPSVYDVMPHPEPRAAEKPEWTHLIGDISKDGKIQTVYRYQTDSLASIAPHIYKFWLEAQETERKITYRSLFLFELNCQSSEYRLTRHITYDKNNVLITDNKYKDAEFDSITPGSLSATGFTKICVIADK